jgi:DNA-binding Lrp family transcriptional regulator
LRDREDRGDDRRVVEELRRDPGKLRSSLGRPLSNSCRQSASSAIICAIDAIDRKIIAELETEGRLTVTELAQRVSLSVAPCHRRLRELERTGAIRGYRAVVDPAAIGVGFEVLVSVTMDREDAATIEKFESGLAQVAEVRHAERLFGDPDYLVRVATADIDSYQRLRDEKLATLPGVQRLSSTIVMKRVVDERPFPSTRT